MFSEYYGEIPKRYHRVAMKYSKLGILNDKGLFENYFYRNICT